MKITMTTETDGKNYVCRMDRCLTELSRAKCNEDWMMDDGNDEEWTLSMNVLDGQIQNIDFRFKVIDGRRTLEPIDVLFWNYGDLIEDSDYFKVKIQ